MRRTTMAAALVAGLMATSQARAGSWEGSAAATPVNGVIGDASFAWRFGRLPTPRDAEQLRVETHLLFAGALLGARSTEGMPSERADRRAALLGALDAYRERGAFPDNTYTDERRPVFVDADGRICAVGHLVEASAGRALAESVAAGFRLAEVAEMHHEGLSDWAATSGLEPRELEIIQPGYVRASNLEWASWAADPPPARRLEGEGLAVRPDQSVLEGAFSDGQMDGVWIRRDPDDVVDGYGLFVAGAGTWNAWDAESGTLRAHGEYVDSVPHGPWRFWWPTGEPSAEGEMANGVRVGPWRYYDQAGRLVAEGSHAHNEVGVWTYYASDGSPFARADFDAWTLARVAPNGWTGPARCIRAGARCSGVWPAPAMVDVGGPDRARVVAAPVAELLAPCALTAAISDGWLSVEGVSGDVCRRIAARLESASAIVLGRRHQPRALAWDLLRSYYGEYRVWDGHPTMEIAIALGRRDMPDRYVPDEGLAFHGVEGATWDGESGRRTTGRAEGFEEMVDSFMPWWPAVARRAPPMQLSNPF